jgi:hypothetical protein
MKAGYVFVLVVAGWALPVFRELKFFSWAWDYMAEVGSINASNDFNYAKSIGIAYLAGIGVMLLLGWMLTRARTGVLRVSMGLAFMSVAHVIWLKPEEPVHLFPWFAPFRFVVMMGALGLVGVASCRDNAVKIQSSSSP